MPSVWVSSSILVSTPARIRDEIGPAHTFSENRCRVRDIAAYREEEQDRR